MSLGTVITEVMARVAVEVPSVTFALGSRQTVVHGSPPRVTWVPMTEIHGAPRKVGALAQRNLVGRAVSVDAHCWGIDLAGAELLQDAVLRALHAECVGSWTPHGATWAQPGAIDLGELVTVRGTLLVPVLEAAAPTTTITSVAPDATGSVAGDGILDVSEP